MKRLIRIFTLFAIINLANMIMPKETAANPPVSVSFQVFYDNLSPYGMWINHSNYGYVWIPNAAGFRPYASNGYWAYTEYGWTWVSNYPWGWAPFHYGRWYYDPLYGDIWVPGYDWGPAWVSWRYSDGYYAWAPLAPGITFGSSYNNYYPPAYRYTCVRSSDFGRTNITNYYVNQSSVTKIIQNSTVIQNKQVSNGQTYIAGPSKTEVQKLSGKSVQQISVQEAPKPTAKVANNTLQIYKPQIQKATGGSKPVPAKVADLRDVKPIKERTIGAPLKPTATPQDRNNIKQQPAQPRTIQPADKGTQRPTAPIKRDEIRERPLEPKRSNPAVERQAEPKPRSVSSPTKIEERQRPVQPRNDNPPPVKREMESPRNISPPPSMGGEQQQPRMNRPENNVSPPQQPRSISPPPAERQQQPVNPNPPAMERPQQQRPNMGGEQQHRQMQSPPPQQRNINAPPVQNRPPQQRGGKPN